MKITSLEFEQPITELEMKIEGLRFVQDNPVIDISEEVPRLASKSRQFTKDLYANLTPWQVVQIARHPQRPYTLDYVRGIFTDFHELHGDRIFTDDPSIVGDLARFNGQTCMMIGHQKGRGTGEYTLYNSGMSKLEGYRKTKWLMKPMDKFGLPIFTLVSTSDTLPSIDMEECGQSEAIGHSLFVMTGLKVSLIATTISEGGSGGAPAIAMGDSVTMLQFTICAVVSPEGCVSTLWRTVKKVLEAVKAPGLTMHRLKVFSLIDKIINEPLGGVHRDSKGTATILKRALIESPRQSQDMKTSEFQVYRHERLMAYGKSKGTEGC